ncbi:MAG TPA: DUF4037 domain-containing protein [Pyrinomonadaceae bacterium]|nr:DUF4037 domain-containing protein [Pyrinomonadaceae bacterium]
MSDFVRGLELGEQFYTAAAKPIIETNFPNLRYSAGMLGWSSEVLGYDDVESMDHNWGPRFQLFLSTQDYERYKSILSESLKQNLPLEFCGYPTNFALSTQGDQLVMKRVEVGPVNHKIDIETIEGWFKFNFGCNPYKAIEVADWLSFSEHKLLAFTSGKVFYDGLRELEPLRLKFSYYPQDVWLYLLSCQWKKIFDEEVFVGRAGYVGDELGSMIIAARIVKNLMQLCFLMEQKYAPYSKWLGTAFSRLKCSAELGPMFREVLIVTSWKEREARLARVYEVIARLHNELQITEPIDEKVSEHGRSYLILHGYRFGTAIWQNITCEEIKRMGFFGGSVNQLVESNDEISNVKLCQKLRVLYE